MVMRTRIAALAIALLFAGAEMASANGGGGGGGGGSSSGGGGGGSSGGGSSGGGSSGGGSAGGGGGAGGNGARGSIGSVCSKGFVLRGNSCVRADSGLVPDDELYSQGRALALAGYYEEALPILQAVKRTDDAMVFTMIGYATRRLGHWDEGMAIYQKALAIDPANVNTHEYLGEGYVTAGRLELARIELAKVAESCGGTNCEQYRLLAYAIETGITQ
jgi:tetratricopeptide (TPR) repeat protein